MAFPVVAFEDGPICELIHMHKAIRSELQNLEQSALALEAGDVERIRTLSARFDFLWAMVKDHSRAEDEIVFPALSARLRSLAEKLHELSQHREDDCHEHHEQDEVTAHVLGPSAPYSSDHRSEEKFFNDIEKLIVCTRDTHDLSDRAHLVALVVHKLMVLDTSLGFHLSKEEKELLPLMREVFTKDEALRLASQISRSVPSAWMKKAASCVRIAHPLDVIIVIHEAIRAEFKSLQDESRHLDPFNDDELQHIGERFQLLSRVVREHSIGEDQVFFPALDAKMRERGQYGVAVSPSFSLDHDCEKELFERLHHVFSRAVAAASTGDEFSEVQDLVMQVRQLTSALHASLGHHLEKEEEELLPQLRSFFSTDEQEGLMGRIIGHRPSAMLEQMLPWLVQTLSGQERKSLMLHISHITRGTMFDKWLSCWWSAAAHTLGTSYADIDWPSGHSSDHDHADAHAHADTMAIDDICDVTELDVSKESIEAVIRKVAKDPFLNPAQKAAKMQALMTQRWRLSRRATEARDQSPHPSTTTTSPTPNPTATSADSNSNPRPPVLSPEEAAPTYRNTETKEFGCKHYKRSCKVRGSCCGRFFTCRLCHDEASDHTMDRYATREMVCMRCSTVQAVGPTCNSDQCKGTPLARYYCNICKFFEDDASKSIYHCPFCNICRVGAGLGIDFFHCMRCNVCMSMSAKDHRCLQNSLECNCPICHNFMFTSTVKVKVMKCGHYMHEECYKAYTRSEYRCPICSKSLADMRQLFERIEAVVTADRQRLPPEHARRTSHILCNDCEKKSTAPFHYLYHKCQHCSSYNTRLQ
mmetsp:Transcript_36701/g.59292  ORF Transcript_36701/g.59292 Transcript_36701/m.59292 type:complete len:814 (-) Transcript_36701:151-2592(-)